MRWLRKDYFPLLWNLSFQTEFEPKSSLKPNFPNHAWQSFGRDQLFLVWESQNSLYTRRAEQRQIIRQKYYKNQIELDHNFVVYEAFQILTQQNREGQIYWFVENLRIEISDGV